jgi:nucleotidyltransferase substrate binding protein (TIGR01987 family)
MSIDTTYLKRCISTIEKALSLLRQSNPESIDYDMYRSACIKDFEIILEQSGKLLRKSLKPYFHSSKAVDQLTFKDVFRQAVLRNIIDTDTSERWLLYRDNRNSTAHDYGVNFAEETLVLLPKFISDAYNLAIAIDRLNQDSDVN